MKRFFKNKRVRALEHEIAVHCQTLELFRAGLKMSETDAKTLQELAHELIHVEGPTSELEEKLVTGLRLVVFNAFELVQYYYQREGKAE